MNQYLDILKSRHLKVTQQRLSVLKYLDNNHTHPTAEDIYRDLKGTYPSLSKTTVYNTLDALARAGIIQQLTISSTELRYEYEQEMHHHFFCRICGAIVDIPFPCPNVETIKKTILKDGYQIDEVHGYFKGICNRCLKVKN